VLNHFVRQGVTDVICTPHIRASQISSGPEEHLENREAALATLTHRLPAGIRLHLGFEIMLDEPLAPGALADRRFSLAGSGYYLVEFLPSVAVDLATGVLQRIAEFAIPLVAHPERYRSLSVQTAGRWHDIGARLQLDATTLTRKSNRGKRAREILAAGLADLIAADNHGTDQSIETAVRFLKERGCGSVVDVLTRANPGAILSDSAMARVPNVNLGGGWIDGVMSFLRG
jgi:tyrosine-protein phosphatase YwqE